MGRGPALCESIPPLTGWRVGITAHRRADEQAELLSRRGAIVTTGPVVRTLPFGDDRPLREATDAVLDSPPDLLIATTGIGIRSWFGAVESWGLDGALRDALHSARTAARGPKARAALAGVGLASDFDEPSERLDGLVETLVSQGVDGARIALQLYGEEVPWAVNRLSEAGAKVLSIPVYRWTLPEDSRPAERLLDDVLAERLDAVTFTSAAAVRSFNALAERLGSGTRLRQLLSSTVLAACVGPITEEAAAAAGFGLRCAPERGRLGLLARTLSDHLHRRHRHLRAEGTDVVLHGSSVWAATGHEVLTDMEKTILDVLAERPGVVVSRNGLRQRIWGQRTADSAIDSGVSRLRRALWPVGLEVQTVHRRGWALSASEACCPVVPDPSPASTLAS